MQWTWKIAEWGMFFFAFFVGVAVFFLPGQGEKLEELERVTKARKAAYAEYLVKQEKRIAEHAEMSKKQAEELGIIYYTPPLPAPAPAAAATPAQ